MFKTILVPLDGSAFSERALPIATALAQTLEAELILVHAVNAGILPGVDPARAQCRAVDEGKTYLAAQSARLSQQGLRVETAVPYGDAAESIALEISLRAADLVVMCTHGRSGLGRWIYGSVAENVLAKSAAPVLLVHPTGEIPGLTTESGQVSIVVPLDGSGFAEAALPYASALARKLSGNLCLLRAVEPYGPPPVYPEYASLPPPFDEGREAESYLEEVAGQLRRDGLSVCAVVRQGWAAESIALQGRELGASLIVMATRGRTGLLRLLLGSVALETVRRSPLPILLVRPGEAAEASV